MYIFFQTFNNKRKKSVSIIYFYNKVNQSFKQYVYLMKKNHCIINFTDYGNVGRFQTNKQNFSGVICEINKYIDERVYE